MIDCRCSCCCNFVQTSNLEKPYGRCGTQGLEYYDSSAEYTVARCQMECSVTSFVEQCGCKDVFMPGISVHEQ